jgi:hypothetical protein
MCESRAQSLGRGDISEVAYVEICILKASTRRARLRPDSDRGSRSPTYLSLSEQLECFTRPR